MITLTENKYKEKTPFETITHIRSILNRLDIPVHEVKWYMEGKYYNSLRMEICGTGFETSMNGIGTNGKGTTAEYALASAYAEFMERLQNLALFFNVFSKQDIEYGGFHRAPDEIQVTANEILDINQRDRFVLPVMSEGALSKFLGFAENICSKDINGTFTAIPYYSVQTKMLKYFPTALLRNTFTTNGMSAGNTPEEALVQGISEIIERYAMLRIETGKITPPAIPHTYINDHMPRIYEMINKLENFNPSMKVIIKECSLGEGLPAYAAILIFPDLQKYWVNFGAHPVMEIALERCLTEFLQGASVSSRFIEKRLEYSYFPKFDTNNMYNHAENLSDCIGYYPNHLFDLKPSYTFNERENPVRFDSNKKMLDSLISIIYNRNLDLLIRDNSFLGFPSFSVLVPGMSQTHLEDADFVFPLLMENDARYFKSFEIIMNINQSGYDDLDFLVNFISDRPESFKLNELFEGLIPDIRFFGPYAEPKFYIQALCLYKMEEYKDAYYAMDEYVETLRETEDDTSLKMIRHRCFRDYLGILSDGKNSDEAIKILSVFFSEGTINFIIGKFGNRDEIFNEFPVFNCFDSNDCKKSGCIYPDILKINNTLKDRYKKNVIDQMGVGKIIHPKVKNRDESC